MLRAHYPSPPSHTCSVSGPCSPSVASPHRPRSSPTPEVRQFPGSGTRLPHTYPRVGAALQSRGLPTTWLYLYRRRPRGVRAAALRLSGTFASGLPPHTEKLQAARKIVCRTLQGLLQSPHILLQMHCNVRTRPRRRYWYECLQVLHCHLTARSHQVGSD